MANNSDIFNTGPNGSIYQNYSFGTDSNGLFVTGNSVAKTKSGYVGLGTEKGAVGKTYLGGSASDLTGDVLSQFNKAMGIQPQTNSLLDTTAQDGGADALSNDALYQNPSSPAPTDYSLFNTPDAASGGQIPQQQSPTGGPAANSGEPGVQIKSSLGGGTSTTINPAHYANQLNYLGYKMLSPQDLKKGLTSGQGLGNSQSAGNLTNPALVQRQSLLGR